MCMYVTCTLAATRHGGEVLDGVTFSSENFVEK